MNTAVFNRTEALRKILAPSPANTELAEIKSLVAEYYSYFAEDGPTPSKAKQSSIASIIMPAVNFLVSKGEKKEAAVATVCESCEPFLSMYRASQKSSPNSLANLIKKFVSFQQEGLIAYDQSRELAQLICEQKKTTDLPRLVISVLKFIRTVQECFNTEEGASTQIAQDVLRHARDLNLELIAVFKAWTSLATQAEKAGQELLFFFDKREKPLGSSFIAIDAYGAMELAAQSTNLEKDLKSLGLSICKAVTEASVRSLSPEEALELITYRLASPIREKLPASDLARVIPQLGEIASQIGSMIEGSRLNVNSFLSENDSYVFNLSYVLYKGSGKTAQGLIRAYDIVISEASSASRQDAQAKAIYGSTLRLAIENYLDKASPRDFLAKLGNLTAAVQHAAIHLDGDIELLEAILCNTEFEDFNDLKEAPSVIQTIPQKLVLKLGGQDRVSALLCRAIETAAKIHSDKPELLNFHGLKLVVENFIWLAENCAAENIARVLADKQARNLLLFAQA